MPEYLSELTDRLQPICLGWLTNQHTSLSIRVDWLTNIPEYLSGMTDQQTYLPTCIRVDWPTIIHTFLSGLTDWQTYLTIYPYWNLCIVSVLPAAYQCMLITYLHIRADWLLLSDSAYLSSYLPIYPAYLSGPTDCLSEPTDWPTSCYLRIYIWTNWLPFMLVFLSCVPVWVNYRPTYMPTYLDWLRRISAFLSCLTNWPTYLSTSLGGYPN